MTMAAFDPLGALAEQLVHARPEIEIKDPAALQGELSALVRWLDHVFEGMALEAGAERIDASDRIEQSILERAGFFESFPAETLVDLHDRRAQTPAVCYQCYPRLSERALDHLGLWTCAARCGRNEKHPGIGRFRTFSMREIVLLGSAQQVRDERARWMEKISDFARSLEINVELRSAADCFFATEESRGRRLLQQVKGLKFELQASGDVLGSGMAIASFNLHETFFARRFRLKLRDGADAYSGCIAFGLERWTLAIALQLGPKRAFALAKEKVA
jgi:hypothetical protein